MIMNIPFSPAILIPGIYIPLAPFFICEGESSREPRGSFVPTLVANKPTRDR